MLSCIFTLFYLQYFHCPVFCTGIRKLEKSVYKEHSETLFGYQQVTSLQLCSMTAPKNKQTGYYKVEHEVQLQTAQEELKCDDNMQLWFKLCLQMNAILKCECMACHSCHFIRYSITGLVRQVNKGITIFSLVQYK